MDYSNLINLLQNPPRNSLPVILPDFFVDHFVIAGSFDEFISNLNLLAKQGGGNLIGTKQMIRKGGNAVNTASALQKIGVNPVVIVKTDEKGFQLLKDLVSPELDLSHVHTDGSLSATVSVEVSYNGRQVNIMMSDSGSASKFCFDDLSEEDLDIIKRSDLVALLCLNHNEAPEELASSLFTFVRNESKALTFMDMGDPSGNPRLVNNLLSEVILEGLVDILSVNENEASWFARAINKSNQHTLDQMGPRDWLEAAGHLSEITEARIDLHTPLYAASLMKGEGVTAPSFVVETKIACGAGDAWNAASIYGSLSGFTDKDRLTFANALAALYVSSENAVTPSVHELVDFLRSNPPVYTLELI